MADASSGAVLDEEQLLAVLVSLKSGDFTARMPAGAVGSAGRIAESVNALMNQLNVLTLEFDRISREIGTEGRFGGQAEVDGVQGRWKELLVNFNEMAAHLTDQIRDFSQTAHKAATGDASRMATVSAYGETAELKDTINLLVEQRRRGNP